MRFIANSLVISMLFGFSMNVVAHEGSEHYGPHMMWHGMVMGPLMMVLFIGIILFVGVFVFRWLGGNSISSREDPINILKMRLARGEINKDEYEEHLQLLKNEK